MEINKEREAFELEMANSKSIVGCLSAFYDPDTNQYQFPEFQIAWHAWQAAKSQATPEGFVLVPKVPSEEILPLNSLYEILDCQECCDAGGFCQERYIQIIEGISKAMIEAQEQSHD